MRKYVVTICCAVIVLLAWYTFVFVLPFSYSRANVIIISIDALRRDHLSCYGYERTTSPNIDALASDSVVFENAFAHIPSTVPSHTTMFTGLYHDAHGIYLPKEEDNFKGLALSKDVKTLAEILHDNGYKTAAFTSINPLLGLERGFDEFTHIEMIKQSEVDYYGEPFKESTLFAWLGRNKEERFFLFFHTYAVHEPYVTPYPDKFRSERYTGPIRKDYFKMSKYDDFLLGQIKELNLTDADIQYLIDLYDSCIFYTDEQLGYLFEYLKERGMYDDSIILIMADHGEEFKEHGGLGHGTVFKEGISIPLILKLPDNRASKVKENIGLVDVTPTILDLLNISYRPKGYDLQGKSVIPFMKMKEEGRGGHTIFASNKDLFMHSVISDKWHYIEFQQEGQEPEPGVLYDMEFDPHEENDILSGVTTVADRLQHMLAEFNVTCRKLHERLYKEKEYRDVDKDNIERLKSLGYLQ